MIKSIQEIQEVLAESKVNLAKAQEKIKNLREERARLSIEDDSKNHPKIDSLDREILDLSNLINNLPIELSLLEENLVAEQNRIAQAEKAELLDQQREIADEVEVLSKNFISLLEKAVGVNQNLVAALSAEAGLAAKTGADVLKAFCHGSQQSLSMLLETMKAQLEGQHTDVVGPGILRDGAPIRL